MVGTWTTFYKGDKGELATARSQTVRNLGTLSKYAPYGTRGVLVAIEKPQDEERKPEYGRLHPLIPLHEENGRQDFYSAA